MGQLVRHQVGASLLAALRAEGLGSRDLFEGRQEPVSWFFRVEAYDQSELDILESGAVRTLHAPSALVELVLDELSLAIANIGPEGLAAYLTAEPVGPLAAEEREARQDPEDREDPEEAAGAPPEHAEGHAFSDGEEDAFDDDAFDDHAEERGFGDDAEDGFPDEDEPAWSADREADGPAHPVTGEEPARDDGPALVPDPSALLGYLNIDVAPPALWLDRMRPEPDAHERLAARLTRLAQAEGAGADVVEVHIEGALDAAEQGWADPEARVRPAGVSVHFSFDIPLAGVDERELARVFAQGARVTARGIERMRDVFRAAD